MKILANKTIGSKIQPRMVKDSQISSQIWSSQANKSMPTTRICSNKLEEVSLIQDNQLDNLAIYIRKKRRMSTKRPSIGY